MQSVDGSTGSHHRTNDKEWEAFVVSLSGHPWKRLVGWFLGHFAVDEGRRHGERRGAGIGVAETPGSMRSCPAEFRRQLSGGFRGCR